MHSWMDLKKTNFGLPSTKMIPKGIPFCNLVIRTTSKLCELDELLASFIYSNIVSVKNKIVASTLTDVVCVAR